MAREILFKAKHIHAMSTNKQLEGRWIEGYLCSEKYINSPELEGEFLIDPNTICQFTGVYDKNGNKIWENDVVQHDFGSGYGIGIQKAFIMYSTEYHGFSIRPINDWQYTHLQYCEVIGNIFDNPELLGGGE